MSYRKHFVQKLYNTAAISWCADQKKKKKKTLNTLVNDYKIKSGARMIHLQWLLSIVGMCKDVQHKMNRLTNG